MDDKTRIRRQVLGKRDSLTSGTRGSKDLRIEENLLSLSEFRQATVIFFFASFRSEVSTAPLMEEALRRGKRVVLPSVDRERRELKLFEIRNLDELSAGYMGIPEPVVPPERERDVNDVNLVVMPGAAFDASGNRLGYGGGYYDKLLRGLRQMVPLVALAYEEQMVDSVPSESHDIRVHMIVTDKRVIRCRPGTRTAAEN